MILSAIDRDGNYTLAVIADDHVRPKKSMYGVDYKSVALLKIGAITIPWPEGMTAEEALLKWRSTLTFVLPRFPEEQNG